MISTTLNAFQQSRAVSWARPGETLFYCVTSCRHCGETMRGAFTAFGTVRMVL